MKCIVSPVKAPAILDCHLSASLVGRADLGVVRLVIGDLQALKHDEGSPVVVHGKTEAARQARFLKDLIEGPLGLQQGLAGNRHEG